jgi:hypothetical protein
MVYLLYGVVPGDVYHLSFLVTAQVLMTYTYKFQSA